jgi:hypothetical protein
VWNLVLVYLKVELASVQDRCLVCIKCTRGSKIILDAPDVTLGDEAQVEAHFSSFGDSVNIDSR